MEDFEFMLMETERTLIVKYGNRLISEGLTQGTAGNISMYDPENGLMAVSPSGIPYDLTSPEDIVVMDLNGTIVDGARKPSSEHALHRVFYEKCPDARAVVHAHSMFCTTLACMGIPLKPVHYALADAGSYDIPLVSYHTFGTPELADAVADCLESGSRGFLLANHGMLAYGDSIEHAFALAVNMEWCAQLQWRCMAAGTPNYLSESQMADAIERFRSYGQTKKDDSGRHSYLG